MSGSPCVTAPGSTNSVARLPAELFYPICAHVTSRCVLLALATCSRVLQRPSEAALHRKISLGSRDRGMRFIAIIRDCPRFASLVQELHIQQCLRSSENEDVEYWEGMRDSLSELRSLNSLWIEDGRDNPLSWVLSALPANRLRTLHCAFIFDTDLLRTLQKQNLLEEFAWKGGLLRLPFFPISCGGDSTRTRDSHDNLSHDPSNSDPDEPLISTIQSYLDHSTLSRLRYLTSESLALARGLVPGRAITHLWVPGAAFSACTDSDFLNDQVIFRSKHETSAGRIQLARPRLDASSTERSEQILRAVEDFRLSRGPILSLRMQLDLHRPELRNVLFCIAQKLPELRTLGFLPACVLEHPYSNSPPKLTDEDIAPPFPGFKHLHTLCLSSTPSRHAVSLLQGSSNHPSLRTVACLHYSPAFEWLCLPINDGINASDNFRRNGISWSVETRVDGGAIRRSRRVTPVHDPEHLLWRIV